MDTIRSHAPVQAGHLEHKELATMCFCGMRSCWLAVKAIVRIVISNYYGHRYTRNVVTMWIMLEKFGNVAACCTVTMAMNNRLDKEIGNAV